MASVSCDANGRKRVLFTNGDGERKQVRLGDVSKRTAETYRERIERILEAQNARTALDPAVAKWLAELPGVMHARFVAVGLAEPRAEEVTVTLGAMLAAFFAAVDVKPASRVRMKQAEAALLGHFGDARDVAMLTEADADQWRAQLKADGYAAATISRTVLYARQVFRWAVRRDLTKSNPFAELKAGPQVNPARTAFIDRDTIAKVIDAAPDAEWRLLIALSRYGGLRVPSEALGLRWSDVDWEHNRLTVRSPKTEHHEGRAERIIPLFPEVREHLLAVFDRAPEGTEWVLGRFRTGYNPNTQLRRIIKRAGVTPWPRTWHNLRASRQTELAASFPLHTVCAWIGNTKAIAAGHYLQVTDADWTRATGEAQGGAESGARAAQKAAQQASAPGRTGLRHSSAEPAFAGASRTDASPCDPPHKSQVGRPGLEPGTPRM